MTVLMAACMAVVIVLATSVAGLGALYAARASAQIAAEAAALAAAVSTYPPASSTGPVQAARDAAAENAAGLVACRCQRDYSLSVRLVEVVTVVTATVPVLGEWEVRAVARAEFDPIRWLGGLGVPIFSGR